LIAPIVRFSQALVEKDAWNDHVLAQDPSEKGVVAIR
jgi:hypothetical protein